MMDLGEEAEKNTGTQGSERLSAVIKDHKMLFRVQGKGSPVYTIKAK